MGLLFMYRIRFKEGWKHLNALHVAVILSKVLLPLSSDRSSIIFHSVCLDEAESLSDCPSISSGVKPSTNMCTPHHSGFPAEQTIITRVAPPPPTPFSLLLAHPPLPSRHRTYKFRHDWSVVASPSSRFRFQT